MYRYDDDYFLFYDYDDEEDKLLANTEDINDDNLIEVYKPVVVESGVFCRSCGEFNHYAEADKVVDDEKYTCWICYNHPERKMRGIPNDKIHVLDEKYKKKT